MTQIAVEVKAPPLERAHAHHLLRQMLGIRRFEDKCAEMYSATKIRGFMHLYNGEEAIATGVMEALTPNDNVVATYREHGQALARGVPMRSVMAEMYGKQEGCSRGRGGSMHIFDAKTRFFGGNAIVGGGLPLGLGLALAEKMQGTGRVTCTFFGDGAAAEGEFYETMNLSMLWNVPALYILENNQYAMGTALRYSHAQTDLARKAAVHGVAVAVVDGMDVLAVEAAAKDAADAVRAGKGPHLLECRTYRFRGHSAFDTELYRTKAEVEEWRKRDPIPNFEALLKANDFLTDTELGGIEHEVKTELDDAVAFAEAGTWEPVADLTRFVYSERK
jgi:pyruvate dehydrogenase E1 component alpha subunit/2-oxoisovalerate dehydrogenase E1 component